MRLLIALVAALACLTLPARAATPLILTSSSATACTSIAPHAQFIEALINASTSAQTVTISFYDEGANPSCASTDLIYAAQLGASQIITFPYFGNQFAWLKNGLAYKLSAAVTNNVVVLYQ